MHPQFSATHTPSVSIIVPCYNEQATIGWLLEAIYQQTYPRDEIEVIVADGLSSDQTRQEIIAFQRSHKDLDIRVIDNLTRTIPSALNRALEFARGEFIVRLDAHSKPSQDYVERCISALEANLGENVGGVWEIQAGGGNWVSEAIAVAAAHPLGVGDARYRLGGEAQAVDTVPFGAYRRTLIQRIGAYDESLLTNEDYEFNVRIRRTGGVVWMDPAIRSVYFARSSIHALARQYLRYGYWKGKMLRRYPSTLRWRQLLPPLFVFSLVLLALLALISPLAQIILFLEIGLYALALLAVGIHAALKHRRPSHAFGVPLAIATMHLCWGSALLYSLVSG